MKHLNLAAVTWLMFAPIVWAGIDSGGGELIKDANNPWFITNTATVEYCIEVAEQGFPYNVRHMHGVVEEIISYWQGEFTKTRPISMFPHVRVASQDFVYSSCTDDIDLKFQFGFMTNDQLKEIEDPTDYIGLAARTHYDKKGLRGKGFIYIAAEEGPFRPNSDKLLEHPWQECGGCLLRRVLLHEMGHVFGIVHVNEELNIMSSEYPEVITRKMCTFRPTENEPLPYFFAFAPTFEMKRCHDPRFPKLFQQIREFFVLPNSVNCIELSRNNTGFTVSAAESINDSFQPLGKVEFEHGGASVSPVTKVYITPAQQVLPPEALNYVSIFSGFITKSEEYYNYQSDSSPATKRLMIIKIDPHGVVVNGIMHNSLINLINLTRPY